MELLIGAGIFSGGQEERPINTVTYSNNNVTFVKATVGRKATIKCVAVNLVGQKTVRSS